MAGAGTARSEAFNLGAATVMIGPKDQVFDFTPEKNSIGLVKNFTFSSSDTYLDLTQGIRNTVVYSVKTGSELTCSMEVYEYTAKNLKYSLGLEGFDIVGGFFQNAKELRFNLLECFYCLFCGYFERCQYGVVKFFTVSQKCLITVFLNIGNNTANYGRNVKLRDDTGKYFFTGNFSKFHDFDHSDFT